MSLLKEAAIKIVAAAKAERGGLSRLAKEIGVDRSTLFKFANGDIPNPGVLQIEAILLATKNKKIDKALANIKSMAVGVEYNG